jgi:dipeptidyl aminopeptidase/acylaminoacyl peptidase
MTLFRLVIILIVSALVLTACAAPQAAPAELPAVEKSATTTATHTPPPDTATPSRTPKPSATPWPTRERTPRPTATPRSTSTAPLPTATIGVPFQLSDLRDRGLIAFRGPDLWVHVINADGSNLRRLKGPDKGPEDETWAAEGFLSFSPDGKYVSAGMDGFLYVLSTDGAAYQKLGSGKIVGVWQTAWSPDGNWIAFTSTMLKGTPEKIDYMDVYIIHPDGSNLRKLTHSIMPCHFPSWSPLSNYLVFHCMSEEGLHIYKASISGEIERMPYHFAYWANWSQDGKKIVYCADNDRLDIMDENGDNIANLAKVGCNFPAISPDGEHIVFEASGELYLVQTDGKHLRKITDNNFFDGYPSWSPDSQYIVYSSRGDIAVVKVATGENLTLANGGFPVWSRGQ